MRMYLTICWTSFRAWPVPVRIVVAPFVITAGVGHGGCAGPITLGKCDIDNLEVDRFYTDSRAQMHLMHSLSIIARVIVGFDVIDFAMFWGICIGMRAGTLIVCSIWCLLFVRRGQGCVLTFTRPVGLMLWILMTCAGFCVTFARRFVRRHWGAHSPFPRHWF